MSTRVWLSIGLLCLGAPMTGCGDDTGATKDTLIYGRIGEADLLDPIHSDVGETVKVVVNLFETLVTYGERSLDIVPSLATRWETSEDGLAWTFHLREGVKFHDGTDMNAEAVVFSFERLIREDHPDVYSNVIPFFASFQVIDRIEIVDPYQVVFHLKHRDAIFLQNMCMYPASIVSPTAVKVLGERFGAEPVGTGPFRFSRWQRDVELELVAFDEYWQGRPRMNRVIFVPVHENAVRVQQIRLGMIHIADNLPPEDVDSLAQDPKLAVQQTPGINVGYLTMQNEKPPLDNVKVRQAIWHAIDKQNLIDEVYAGHGKPAVSMMPPTLWGYHDGLVDRAYDPERARSLLAEAGLETPIRMQLYVMKTSRPYMQRPRETAIFIKAQLAQVGFEIEIVTQDNNLHFQQLRQGEHDLGLTGWSTDNNDPDNFLYQLLDPDNINNSGNNMSRYRNARVHELLLAAKEELDKGRRARMYREAQELIFADAPGVPLVHTDVRIVLQKYVKGYYLHPTGSMVRLRGVYFEDTRQ